ncbi:MAG TPA: low affinity iron permease family protein [Thermomicrobiaceae bacterium]|nr:low affinity iron permease family protein [Thermomicrobiaceae bacterium]
MREFFGHIATKVAYWAGAYWAFLLAVTVVIVWGLTGPIFGFSDTWQLVINTGTTIVTFLMVFLIQNSQNRESAATQLKLDEIIRALEGASNHLIDIEEAGEARLDHLKRVYERVSAGNEPEDQVLEELAEEATEEAEKLAATATATAEVAEDISEHAVERERVPHDLS